MVQQVKCQTAQSPSGEKSAAVSVTFVTNTISYCIRVVFVFVFVFAFVFVFVSTFVFVVVLVFVFAFVFALIVSPSS